MISEYFTVSKMLPPFAICREDGTALIGDPDFGEALFEEANKIGGEDFAGKEGGAFQVLQRSFRVGKERYVLRAAIPPGEVKPPEGKGNDDMDLFAESRAASVEEVARPLIDLLSAVLGYTDPHSVARRSCSVQMLYEELLCAMKKGDHPILVDEERRSTFSADNTACVDREGLLLAISMIALDMVQAGSGKLHFTLDAPQTGMARYTLCGERDFHCNGFLRAVLSEMGQSCGFRVGLRRNAVEIVMRLEQKPKMFLQSSRIAPMSLILQIAMGLFGRPHEPTPAEEIAAQEAAE